MPPAVAETPEQAIARLNKEIAQLRILRAQIPMVVLKPYADEAIETIRRTATALAMPAMVPELPEGAPQPGTTVTVLPDSDTLRAAEACIWVGKDDPRWPECSAYDVNGDDKVDVRDIATISKGMSATAITAYRASHSSPEIVKVLVLRRDGRLVEVEASQLRLGPAPAPSTPLEAPAAALASGSHVRERTTGKTGYITEVADGKAMIALDEGGAVTRLLDDLEPA